MRKIVISSGGLDSTTALVQEISKGHECIPLFIHYGNTHHDREFASWMEITSSLGLSETRRQITISLSGFDSALLATQEIPNGEYHAGLTSTIVPFRNAIFISYATGLADSIGAQAIVLGNHASDFLCYPDCRPEFVNAMREAVRWGTVNSIVLETPLIDLQKADIVKLGYFLGAPLAKTWSCYRGGEKQCGVCPSCLCRKEAFVSANVPDDTEYEA